MTPPRGLFWPLLLIVVGILFLASNLGYVPPLRASTILALWPVLLILIGIDIALARRWPVPALAIEALVIAGAVALVLIQPIVPAWWVAVPSGETTVSEARQSQDESLTLHVSGGAGSYTIAGGADELVEATADQPRLRIRASRGGTAVDVRLDQDDGQFRFGPGSPSDVEIRVATDITTSLDVNAGAGDFVVDLAHIRAKGAKINVGAAQLRVVLPSEPRGDVPITIAAGASSVVVEIPDGVEAQVTMTGALTSLHSENDRFSAGATPGYAGAADRVTVKITGGASSVTIR